MDKTNAVDLSSHVSAVLINVSPDEKSVKFIIISQFSSKLANGDITKEALNCTAAL